MEGVETAPAPDIAARGALNVLGRNRRIAVTIGVILGSFLAALEATVVGTAMPTVVATLGGIERFSWVFSGYLLTSTVSVPIWGKLSDLYGRRRLYQIGIGLFLIGSVLAGCAMSMNQLIVYRAIQGLGAGALVPLGMTIIGEIYSTEERGRMQGIFSASWGVASILGPIAGGFITDHLSWRWVFLINVPFGLAAATIIGVALVETKRAEKPKIDYPGAATLTAGITLLLFALVEGGTTNGWFHPITLGLFLAALICGIAFVKIERKASEPIIPLTLFKNRTIAVGNLSGFLTGIAMFGAISFIPLYVQGVTGATATEAGSALSPLLLSWVVLSIVSGRLMLRVSVRTMVVSGTLLVTTGFVVLAVAGAHLSRGVIMADMVLLGGGMGLAVFTLLIATQTAAPPGQLGIVTSLSQFGRSIGGAVGVALMGAILASGLAARMATLAAAGANVAAVARDPNALLEPSLRAQLPPEALATLQTALADALVPVFGFGSIVMLFALASAFFIPTARLGERR